MSDLALMTKGGIPSTVSGDEGTIKSTESLAYIVDNGKVVWSTLKSYGQVDGIDLPSGVNLSLITDINVDITINETGETASYRFNIRQNLEDIYE
jgi:hypothetical protein